MPRLPVSQPSPGSPLLGLLPPVEARSSMNPSKAGSSQQCTPAGQHRSPATPPPKSSKSPRSPRRLSSKAERDCTSDACQDLKPRSSSDEDLVLAENQVGAKKLRASEIFAEEKAAGEAEKGKVSEIKEEEEQVQEEQNFVPRKAAGKCAAEAGQELPPPQGSPPNKTPKKKYTVKKEKLLQFSVALTRSEIEEDMFAMTGLRLSRKPKKRPKKLQDVVDHLSPAFNLQTVTPSLYSTKG